MLACKDEHQVELRPEVAWFAQEMEKILRQNDHRSNRWCECDEMELFQRLDDKIMTLDNALHAWFGKTYWGRVIKEAVHVANYAMMIADLARKKV